MDAEDRVTRRAARAAFGLLRFDWSEARVALLARRWAQGASAGTIEKELGGGVSRCAVLGKIHRLKLPPPELKRHQAGHGSASQRPRGRGATGNGRRARSLEMIALRAAVQALGLDPPEGEPDGSRDHPSAGKAFGTPCTFLALTAVTCRWPVGTPGDSDFAFCGAPPFRRRPYCLAHCLIAYRCDGGEREPRTQRESLRPGFARGVGRAA
jgi:GcrA cell cycle regulator